MVVCAMPSRRPISASLRPCSRHARACSHCPAVTDGGRPGPGRPASSAADPSCLALFYSVDTYASVSPSSRATARPGKPICRSAASATFRIPVSEAS